MSRSDLLIRQIKKRYGNLKLLGSLTYKINVTLNLFQGLISLICYNKTMDKTYTVYILTNYNETTFYIGVTGNLQKRIFEHKNKVVEGFTKKYNVDKLVYYEITNDVESAINREKQLKRWHRQWKINLIKEVNPEFKDLSENW